MSDETVIRTSGNAQVRVFTIKGDVDVYNAYEIEPQLSSALDQASVGLIVDMTNVPYIDSAGLGALIRLAEQAKHDDKQLHIVIPEKSPIRRTMIMVAMFELVPFHDDLATAQQALQSAALAG